MEGVVINYDGAASGSVPYMYVAMSEVGKGMVDDIGDIQLDSTAKMWCSLSFWLTFRL